LRIGELLKIKVSDVSDRTITLREPKLGKKAEMAYMPGNMSRKLARVYQAAWEFYSDHPSKHHLHIICAIRRPHFDSTALLGQRQHRFFSDRISNVMV
jgi:hypothetical protein